jgi:Mrp family chromosome partitioning ATPase
LKNLLAALKASFDMIIVDAPVTLSTTDVPIMASAMDGVLFIYSPSKSDKAALGECKKILTKAGAHIIGVVANKINLQDQRGCYSSKCQGYKYYADHTSSKPECAGVIDVDVVDMRPELSDDRSLTSNVTLG